MIGLIKKDIYLILKNLSAVYLLAFLIVIIPATQNLEMLFPMLSFLVAMILSTQIAATMALDEKSNWKKMVFAMPLSKYAEVASKYLLSLLLGIISAGFVFLFGVLFAYGLPNLTKGWDEVIAYSGVSFCICVLYNAIMIPATYKFGASKSRMVLLVIVAILPTVGTLIMKKTGIKLSTIALTPQTIVMLCLGGILVIEFVSFMLSIKIRKKRE